jgi:hypothetical protein
MAGSKVNREQRAENKETNRHLVLIDVENIAGSPYPTPPELAAVEQELHSVIADLDEAQRVVACSHRAARRVAFSFPGALHRWRSGVDGADLALLDELSDLRVMHRYGRVTLCSGDGIFADSLAALAQAGLETEVVARASALSGRLKLSAQHVVELGDSGNTPPITEFGKAS